MDNTLKMNPPQTAMVELASHPNPLALKETVFSISHALQHKHPMSQIAIIGDISSGKTSLFEALTGLTFPAARRPRQTNFAVHAQFRRTTDGGAYARAYIRPGPGDEHYEAAVQHLHSFESVHCGVLSGGDFVDMVHKAAAHMCLDVAGQDDDEEGIRSLSGNMLVVDIAGPDVHNLSVIDFPGMVRIKAVRGLMMNYLADPNTIIVAVVDATCPIPNQTALEMALSVDPVGRRTVGVLTKCDLVPSGDEQRVLRIFRNKQHHLKQGWFAVKNWSLAERRKFEEEHVPEEASGGATSKANAETISEHQLQARNASECVFFSRSPWDSLAQIDRSGVVVLREFLRDLVISTLQSRIDAILSLVPMPNGSTSDHSGHSGGSSIQAEHEHGPVAETEPGAADSSKTVHYEKEQINHKQNTAESGDNLEAGVIKKRPTVIYNAVSVCLTIILTLTLVGLGCEQLAQEIATDGDWTRLFLLVTTPLQVFVSLFFCQSIINTVAQIFGPVSQLQTNSKYYSAHPVQRLDARNGPLPHVTIQCPVYKEGLEAVIRPTVTSLEAAICHYRSCGGTANIFINDDGMQLLSPEDAAERKEFYLEHGIGWVARPEHAPDAEGLKRFIRRGKFKKASNMNYALGISIKVEDKLVKVDDHEHQEKAYQRCLAEVLEEEQGRAWADGDIRVGDYILIVDSDTRIPEACMIDAVSELEESPQVAILQFSSGVMNVTTSYFEMGITFFTDLIYTAIRFAVASGDVSPFVGHNAFLRWSALQEVSFQDFEVLYDNESYGLSPGEPDCNSTTPYEKFWSESHVSEDFDISLRLQTTGYHVRLGAYYGGDFKEGVSLTVYDELARWEKYAYGCSELLFHPLRHWPRRGIFTPLFRRFITSSMPLGSKVTVLAYIGTYYAIGYAWLGSLLNYFLVGWYNGHLDHFYMNSWRVWVALVVVFSGAGNLALAVVRYRGEGGNSNLMVQLWISFRWVPLLFVFFGGISMHVGQAILAHMLSVDMSWGATAKEVSDTSFFIEMPVILRRFKFAFLFCLLMVALIVCGAYAFPYLWRIKQLIAIFPLTCIIVNHFLLPVLLNPALMKFTW
ncbi:glycosyl transferase family 2 [Ophiostoma piceae UAMH 11346]|uniref:Glycosyl transferase family 2 n=1 Tax=Ophiostoma piceae (strain UAMH 11346) TaxID=1262450 RepID=S3CWZ4_OPHP1|nr:glycosyl transferase family 2 [Ophiostoma piceae UAMH 11346]